MADVPAMPVQAAHWVIHCDGSAVPNPGRMGLGAVLTGVFASPDLGGTGVWDYVTNQVAEGYSILTQVKIQVIGVLVTVAWTALVSAVAYKLVDLLIGLRVKEDAEREGLDVTSHGEKAYSL